MKGGRSRKLIIPEAIWQQTWVGLRERSRGEVESAAVWGGKRTGLTETVEAVYFLNDYGGSIQLPLYHRVPAEALKDLFLHLHRDQRVLIGDIHTHPESWVGLSDLDAEHPIEYRKGVIAVVLPWYGGSEPSLQDAGVHEYAGKGRWKTFSERAKKKLFLFTKQP